MRRLADITDWPPRAFAVLISTRPPRNLLKQRQQPTSFRALFVRGFPSFLLSVPPLPRGPWPIRRHHSSSRQNRAVKNIAGRASGGDAIVPRSPPAKAARTAPDEHGQDEAGQPVYGQITKPFSPLERDAEERGKCRSPSRPLSSADASFAYFITCSTPRKPACRGGQYVC